jgi:hypothetical protein
MVARQTTQKAPSIGALRVCLRSAWQAGEQNALLLARPTSTLRPHVTQSKTRHAGHSVLSAQLMCMGPEGSPSHTRSMRIGSPSSIQREQRMHFIEQNVTHRRGDDDFL